MRSPQRRREVQATGLLEEYRDLFDGSLGKWKGEKYDIELKQDAKPYHSRAFPIPRVHEQSLRMEVDRLCQEGVLRKMNDSEWAAPMFIIPKKDGTVYLGLSGIE